jgi:hypothetical protein
MLIRILLTLVLAAGTASCSVLDTLQRELIFRPVTQEWSGYSPSILNAEDVWIPVGANGDRLHG